ncbi:hypothetical protein [Massilia sp. PWRC2]|uniref:hypothetical protein n=1 Tax=Massilia sp. PWRC2 TaxID=2804626 RepID=UPI003CF4E11F
MPQLENVLKKIIGITMLAAVACPALAATANWTGRQEMVQTVTYQSAWNCQYMYGGQTFWRVFKTSCPSSVEVQ